MNAQRLFAEEDGEVMRDERHESKREAGFALILAILALMLLTFLGLTLATTTSTELQIATNFRWSQQALANAQAGIEAAKMVLATVPTGTDWSGVVPPLRPGSWAPSATAGTSAPAGAGRDYERFNCRDRGVNGGVGVGYGLVLNMGGTRYENISSFTPGGGIAATPINGAFTLWVRREIVVGADGQFSEDASVPFTQVVLTVEGVAPYVGAQTAFTRANQATRILEVPLTLVSVTTGNPCAQLVGQEGKAPSGENFDPCSTLTAGGTGSLGTVFGGAAGVGGRVGGAGALTQN
jgi:hypothetical protein